MGRGRWELELVIEEAGEKREELGAESGEGGREKPGSGDRGEVDEQMRAEADKREWDEGGKEVLGKGGIWIKKRDRSRKGRTGFRERFSHLRGHGQESIDRMKKVGE